MANLHDRAPDFRAWDADWYLKIAERGYAAAGEGMVDANGDASPDGPMAFFPGYPLLVRLFAPLVGHHYVTAGLVVSTLAGIGAAYGVARLARHFGGGRRAQLLSVALVAGAPMSVVYTLPYPEALLIALSAWILVAVLERRWWYAAPLTVAAGLVNPMAAPLIPVVIVAAGVDVYQERARWGAATAAMVAPAGLVGYLLWVRATSDAPGGYFEISREGWGNEVDFGVATAKWVFGKLTSSSENFLVLTALAIITACAGYLLTWRKVPWPVSAYMAMTLALIVGHSGLIHDRVRLLLSAFPLLILLAVRLGHVRFWRARPIAGVVVLVGLWFGAYSLTVWEYAI
ncbi:hypothetical protein [Amycolatopsis thermoflava]|uniref:hypothetical protein n=1 Tax=Amycolatopsis thermoflava TaxID=84480 RepID=UPI003F49D893